MSSSQNTKPSLYPQVPQSHPDSTSPFLSNPKSSSSASSSLYPSLDMQELAENLFPDDTKNDTIQHHQPSSTFKSSEKVLIKIPGSIVNLIDTEQSIQLATGDFSIVSLNQNDTVVAVFARVGDELQWPLAKDEPAVKLDESHYFFTIRVPAERNPDREFEQEAEIDENLLNYGLTIGSKVKKSLLKDLDVILEKYSAFSVKEVDMGVVVGEKKEEVERNSVVYWTALAPNVEDYSTGVGRMIATGSGHLIKGILWCGDVTVDRLRWANEFLKIRIGCCSSSEISPKTLRTMKRVNRMTKMSDKVATGILSGVVKVSGFFTSSITNSTVGQKFFSLLPGEIVLASLDGFNKVCDAVEVAGRNVLSTTSVVTTGLVSHRYGEQAAEVTHDGLGAAGYAIGTAWAVFKIRKALSPKSAFKPTTLAKAAAEASSAKSKAIRKK